MQIEIINASTNKNVCEVRCLTNTLTIMDMKREIHANCKKFYPERQSLRLEPRGKSLRDEDTLENLGLKNGSKLYLKDLGPQIGWTTVFLAEYAGPLIIYLLFHQRPWIIYGKLSNNTPMSLTANIAAACWTGHYAKRLLETVFVHRFSHATMPFFNLFKNCGYYWMFTAFVAYNVNHPLFTSPSLIQVYVGLAGFILSELGNFSIHIALRNLRPPGTKKRSIPVPTGNPFTNLFDLVSCPNYTYEVAAWLSFSVMTQCLPAALFTFAGFYQMAVWALGKHQNYKKEFSNYPKSRKAIIPFLL